MPTGLDLVGSISSAGAPVLRHLRLAACPVCSLCVPCQPAFAHSRRFGILTCPPPSRTNLKLVKSVNPPRLTDLWQSEFPIAQRWRRSCWTPRSVRPFHQQSLEASELRSGPNRKPSPSCHRGARRPRLRIWYRHYQNVVDDLLDWLASAEGGRSTYPVRYWIREFYVSIISLSSCSSSADDRTQ